MRRGRLRLGAIAAVLGMMALGLDALVPVHLAFDLAEAVATGEPHNGVGPDEHDFEWRLLARVAGHHDTGVKSDGHSGRRRHHADCAVCSAIGTLAGVAPAAAVKFPLPATVEAPIVVAAIIGEPDGAPAAAYHSRAPPPSADPTA